MVDCPTARLIELKERRRQWQEDAKHQEYVTGISDIFLIIFLSHPLGANEMEIQQQSSLNHLSGFIQKR